MSWCSYSLKTRILTVPNVQANQRRASKMLDAEQSRRVGEAAEEEVAAAAERTTNQKAAVQAMEGERERRSSAANLADQLALNEAKQNRKHSIESQEKERKERVAKDGTAPMKSPLKSCFTALKDNTTKQE